MSKGVDWAKMEKARHHKSKREELRIPIFKRYKKKAPNRSLHDCSISIGHRISLGNGGFIKKNSLGGV